VDDAKGIPVHDESPEQLILSRLQHMEAQMATMFEKVNQQLAEIRTVVQMSGSMECARQDAAQTTDTPQTPQVWQADDDWAAQWTNAVNMAFEMGTAKDVCAAIQNELDSNGQKLVLVDFDNVAEYEQDHKYALFSKNATGICFLVGKPGDDQTFAAFPYPASPTWFLMGKHRVKALYAVLGAEDARAPSLRIQKPALLHSTGKINASGYDVLMSLQKGELIAR